MKLWKGIRIIIWKQNCGKGQFAGGYDVHYINMLSSKAKVEMSGGQPFNCAYRQAELLAVIIDAELVLKEGINETIIRKPLSGEYK